MEEYNQKGFPEIKLYKDYFKIRAIDISTFRTFNCSEISKIEYLKKSEKGNWFFMPWIQAIYSNKDTYQLKISKQNGGTWVYKTHSKNSDSKFEGFIEKIKNHCDLNRKQNVTKTK